MLMVISTITNTTQNVKYEFLSSVKTDDVYGPEMYRSPRKTNPHNKLLTMNSKLTESRETQKHKTFRGNMDPGNL